MAADGALLPFGLGAVGDVFLQGTLHAVLPGVDALALQLQRADQLDDVLNGHAIAQHTRNQLGVVPVFGVEFLRESLHGGLVAALVLKLEVVTLGAVGIHLLDDFSFGHRLGQHDAFLVVLQTREYFVRIALQQAHKGHPLLFVVLETHHVALQHLRAHFGHLGMLVGGGLYRRGHVVAFVLGLLLVFLRNGNHYARAAAVAIDGTALAA